MRPDPRDPDVVEALIAATSVDAEAMEFLLYAPLEMAAIHLGAHVFTIESARARLLVEVEVG